MEYKIYRYTESGRSIDVKSEFPKGPLENYTIYNLSTGEIKNRQPFESWIEIVPGCPGIDLTVTTKMTGGNTKPRENWVVNKFGQKQEKRHN